MKDESEEIDRERGLERLKTTGNCGDRGRKTREEAFGRERERVARMQFLTKEKRSRIGRGKEEREAARKRARHVRERKKN